MKKLTTTLCLTVVLVMGFNTASSSQGFETLKTLYYKGETGTNSRIEIKITPDGKSYKATIYSGKFKYKCSSAPLLPGGILDISECGDIDPADPNLDEVSIQSPYGSDTLTVEGSLDLVVGGNDGGMGRGTKIEFTPDRQRLLHSPSIADPLKSNIPNTKAKTQISKTSARPLSQKLVTLKTLYYKAETGANSRIEIKITPDGKSYKATIYSGKFKYKCSSAPLLPGGILDISECGDIDPWDPNRDNEPNATYGSDTLTVEGSLDLVVGGYDGGMGRGTMIEYTPDRQRLLHSPSIAHPLKSNIPNSKARTQISKTSAGPLSQKLVTLKTLLKGGLITQKDYNTKRADVLKEISGGKVDPTVQKLKRLKKLLDQKLISPAAYEYKSRKILDEM